MPQKKYIVVAEDDQFYGSIYKTKLTKEGFDVTVAENGKLAMEAIKKRKPDLILLDIMMPVQDGFTTLEQIRKDPLYKKVKILVMSNLGQKEDITKAKKLGANDFFVKADLSIQELIEKIKQNT